MQILAAIAGLLILSGCATTGRTIYIPVPEGYLTECILPAKPTTEAELSDAFAQAYLCGHIGNLDKRAIKELQNSYKENNE